MAADLVLRGAQLPDRDSPVDLVVKDGVITDVGRAAGLAARKTIDLGGRVVTPGLVEAHIHLDKALLDDRVAATTGTLAEAIRVTAEAKRGFEQSAECIHTGWHADLVDLTYVAAVAAHMGTPADLRRLLNTVTVHPAAMLRLPGYGLDPGCRADLIAWDCERVEDVVATRPSRALVVKRGRVTLQYECRLVERWRDAP